ncbi:Gfo/Idh/MocA family oxidoreductase [Paenibacillus albicereus]|uniref:Gfo/Idh/MocA family oxidoreductase n=1 Tax=Paenibacillus albicereus TaxID=2726185 RepID=A0A6H2GT93_9BACL|nr:Gfo/Idh/MocA family oxidoreductase [Paenibacillus albicereus]QJC50579.1 Gfo/Idh/MocA family oxidoreductase [Paenibacillus albicereus]
MGKDGMNYAPEGKPRPVVSSGEFRFAAAHLDHGHIYGMCNGLTEAGGTLASVYDPQPERAAALAARYPGAAVAGSLEEILQDPDIRLVAAAAVPSERGPLGVRVMEHGKDYFTDKTPFTELAQLELARATAARTGQKYAVYYSERLHVESAVFAGRLIEEGAIGRVVQVIGTGPHRLNAPSRPGWFFERERYGGILCDIGSHQIEQFLHYAGCRDAQVLSSKVGNFANPDHPELEDFGDATLLGDNGASHYFRVDWLTPAGLSAWGDGRTILLGTEGYIELRKYVDIARGSGGDQLYLVDGRGEHRMELGGKVGFPYFGQLILDVLNRTEHAMTQEHAFKAAELCLRAQAQAVRIPTASPMERMNRS